MRNRMMVLIAILGLGLGARAGETLSPETPLPLHEKRDAYTPCAAFGKDVFLVARQSGHLGAGDLLEGHVGIGDLVACRVDKSGKALDAAPFVVSTAADLQERPKAAFGGSVFLVVWQDLRNGKDYDVYAARVTGEGKVLDADGILVSGGAHNQANPRVVWDGESFLVVWQDYRSGKKYEAYGARVSKDGRVLDPQGVVLGSGKFYQCLTPAAASSGGGRSMVMWVGDCGSGATYKLPAAVTLFMEGGKVVTPEAHRHKFTRDHGPGRLANPICLAAGTKSYLAAWTTDVPVSRGNAPGKSTAAIYDAGGQRGEAFFLAGKAHRIRNPEACWDGTAYVAVWHEFRMKDQKKKSYPYEVIRAARISESGKPVGPLQEVAGESASPASMATVASDGKGTTLVAYERHPKTGDVPIKIAFRLLRAR